MTIAVLGSKGRAAISFVVSHIKHPGSLLMKHVLSSRRIMGNILDGGCVSSELTVTKKERPNGDKRRRRKGLFSKEKLTLGCQVCFRARNVCLKRLFETFVSKPAEGGGREGPPGGGGKTN